MRKEKLHIVSLFHLNANIAGKDMFLVPMYLGRHLGASVELVYPKADFNKEFSGEYRGVKLTPIRSGSKYYSTLWSEKEMGWWLIKNARRIDVLYLFWLNPRNALFARIYKLLNPKGVCYIKGDINTVAAPSSGWKQAVWEFLYRAVDVLSVETQDIYGKITAGILGEHLKNHTVLMSNGFDIELFEHMSIVRKAYAEKERLILTVGRIGSVHKNNEMMLEALDGMDMRGWHFWFVGPVEEKFKSYFEDFLQRNPEKREYVKLIGGIYDKKELWEVYNKAKIFVLTSSKECMAQVFSEALAFGNYIVTTDVQGSVEITDRQRLGRIVKLNDVHALREALQEVIQGTKDISALTAEAIRLSDEKYNWRSLTQPVAQRIKEVYDSKNS